MITILFFLHFLSTDFLGSTEFFCPQIITDYFFGTEIRGFFKDTAWLRIDIIHGTSWLRLAGASSRLSYILHSSFFSRVYTLV